MVQSLRDLVRRGTVRTRAVLPDMKREMYSPNDSELGRTIHGAIDGRIGPNGIERLLDFSGVRYHPADVAVVKDLACSKVRRVVERLGCFVILQCSFDVRR